MPFILVLALLASGNWSAGADEFLPEERLTTDESRNYQTSWSPNHTIAVDSTGTVHLVFWDGGLATNPDTPSSVWYTERAANGGWTAPEMVDDSFTDGDVKLGGRNPCLLARPDGSIVVFWHDYRHCTEGQRWIDNVEIYMDRRPPGGSFSENDIHLTTTISASAGDNGYLPQPVQAPGGEIYLTWYDFHADADVADIYLMKSDPQGVFDTAAAIETHRLTNAAARGNTPSYGLPDLALDLSGNVHLVWTVGDVGGTDVYYARYGSDESFTTPILLAAGGATYFDPPRITAAPNGDIYALWTENGGAGRGKDLMLARLRDGETVFDPAMSVVDNSANQSAGDLEVGTDGLVRLTWTDERSGSMDIYYGVYDPVAQTLESETALTETSTASRQPCIALDENMNVYVAWTDNRFGNGQIYFRTNKQPADARSRWALYK